MLKYNSCSVKGCDHLGEPRPDGVRVFKRGFCSLHYGRLKTHGDPLKANRIVGENRGKNPLYQHYQRMKTRCFNKRGGDYYLYGGRGIKICERWLGQHGFNNFLIDMGGYSPGLTLDRIDVNGNYCKENCRWATQFAQQNNRRKLNRNPGVHKHPQKKVWSAYVGFNGTHFNLGTFREEHLAVCARYIAVALLGAR